MGPSKGCAPRTARLPHQPTHPHVQSPIDQVTERKKKPEKKQREAKPSKKISVWVVTVEPTAAEGGTQWGASTECRLALSSTNFDSKLVQGQTAGSLGVALQSVLDKHAAVAGGSPLVLKETTVLRAASRDSGSHGFSSVWVGGSNAFNDVTVEDVQGGQGVYAVPTAHVEAARQLIKTEHHHGSSPSKSQAPAARRSAAATRGSGGGGGDNNNMWNAFVHVAAKKKGSDGRLSAAEQAALATEWGEMDQKAKELWYTEETGLTPPTKGKRKAAAAAAVKPLTEAEERAAYVAKMQDLQALLERSRQYKKLDEKKLVDMSDAELAGSAYLRLAEGWLQRRFEEFDLLPMKKAKLDQLLSDFGGNRGSALFVPIPAKLMRRLTKSNRSKLNRVLGLLRQDWLDVSVEEVAAFKFTEAAPAGMKVGKAAFAAAARRIKALHRKEVQREAGEEAEDEEGEGEEDEDEEDLLVEWGRIDDPEWKPTKRARLRAQEEEEESEEEESEEEEEAVADKEAAAVAAEALPAEAAASEEEEEAVAAEALPAEAAAEGSNGEAHAGDEAEAAAAARSPGRAANIVMGASARARAEEPELEPMIICGNCRTPRPASQIQTKHNNYVCIGGCAALERSARRSGKC